MKNNNSARKLPLSFPRIGFRILKTAFAVFLILSAFQAAHLSRTPFYVVIATILCMQPDLANSRAAALNRTIGTFIGAFFAFGITFLEVNLSLIRPGTWIHVCFVSCCIILIIYSTVIIERTPSAFISCVVFLSVAVIPRGETDPYEFIFFRILDTLSGVFLAYFINWLHLPRKKEKNILFISALDDTLLSVNDQMSSYSRRELNRMIGEGANFTISTSRTPASIVEAAKDINLKFPVIAMHGSVLYDIAENRYLLKYIINPVTSSRIEEILERQGYHYFENVILDDVLLIYYPDFKLPVQKEFYEKYRKSPYRNYVHQKRPKEQGVVYFTLLEKEERLTNLRNILNSQDYSHTLRFIIRDSGMEGYKLLHILCKNATKENMIDYLQQMLSLDTTITFGSIDGQYDVVVRDGDMDFVVKTMKKTFEPVGF